MTPPATRPDFPLLTMIDTARGGAHPLAIDPQASALEVRARTLADEFWPETVWLTGAIPAPLLDAVASRLEAERETLHEGIRLFIATERPAASALLIAATAPGTASSAWPS